MSKNRSFFIGCSEPVILYLAQSVGLINGLLFSKEISHRTEFEVYASDFAETFFQNFISHGELVGSAHIYLIPLCMLALILGLIFCKRESAEIIKRSDYYLFFIADIAMCL